MGSGELGEVVAADAAGVEHRQPFVRPAGLLAVAWGPRTWVLGSPESGGGLVKIRISPPPPPAPLSALLSLGDLAPGNYSPWGRDVIVKPSISSTPAWKSTF